MARKYLKDIANERGSIVIDARVLDENKQPVVPSAITWTLSKPDGTLINGRVRVTETPALATAIKLAGADLAVDEAGSEELVSRVLTIEAAYDSVEFGNGVPVKDEYWFQVKRLLMV